LPSAPFSAASRPRSPWPSASAAGTWPARSWTAAVAASASPQDRTRSVTCNRAVVDVPAGTRTPSSSNERGAFPRKRAKARAMVAPGGFGSVSGLLITLEGVEGSGKTTQMARLERWLRRQERKVERPREPDGTRLGLAVRRLFERPGVKPEPLVEVFLFMAARQQHVAQKIRPW